MYILVQKDDSSEFLEEVNNRIKEGYECLGGVAITTDTTKRFAFTQALIKHKVSKPAKI